METQGPPNLYDTNSKAYQTWQQVGQILNASKPRGLVVVSAHWEADDGDEGVEINTNPSNPLIYDFYGFPRHYYAEKFTSHGTPELVAAVEGALKDHGIKYSEANRGFDHGVWVPLKIAFNGSTDIPIVQVSLPGNSHPVSTAKLGRSLGSLLDQGYDVIASGMAIHNLRDFISGRTMPYAKPFFEAITTSLNSPKSLESALTLFRHPAYKQAHPSPEHLLPLVVAVGAAQEGQKPEALFEDPNVGWGFWRWSGQSPLVA